MVMLEEMRAEICVNIVLSLELSVNSNVSFLITYPIFIERSSA